MEVADTPRENPLSPLITSPVSAIGSEFAYSQLIFRSQSSNLIADLAAFSYFVPDREFRLNRLKPAWILAFGAQWPR